MKLKLTIDVDNKNYDGSGLSKTEIVQREKSLLAIFGVEKYTGALVTTAVKTNSKISVNVQLIGDTAEE